MDANLNDSNVNTQQRRKADYVPEVYFIGQIVGGIDFPTEKDGIFIEATLAHGSDWEDLGEKDVKKFI